MEKIARRPQVGIWWMNGDNLNPFPEPAPAPLDYSYSTLLHDTYWDYVQSDIPDLRSKQYTSLPRGRVESTPTGFNIMLAPEMKDDEAAIEVILRAFSIPKNNYTVVIDEHFTQTNDDLVWEDILGGDPEGEFDYQEVA